MVHLGEQARSVPASGKGDVVVRPSVAGVGAPVVTFRNWAWGACHGGELPSSYRCSIPNAAIDRLVWYAGWADKLTQVVGNANPVAGPFFNLSSPEPCGVIAVLAPQKSSLLGLVSVMAPAIISGNTVVVVSSYARPVPAIDLAEVLATSDVPGGVVNLLTGDAASIGPWLASHMDVNAIDLCGVSGSSELLRDLEVAAADNLKRVRRAPGGEPDWSAEPSLTAMTDFLEIKTVWHPLGV